MLTCILCNRAGADTAHESWPNVVVHQACWSRWISSVFLDDSEEAFWYQFFYMRQLRGMMMTLNEIESPAHADTERVVREQLDQLDALLQADPMHSINAIQLGEARGIVASVMQDLQAHPELDSILADRDVRNIIIFVKQTKEVFSTQYEEKREVRQKKTTKAAALQAGANAMLAAMSRLGMGAVPPTAALPKPVEDDSDVFSVLPGGVAKIGVPAEKTPTSDPLASMRNLLDKGKS